MDNLETQSNEELAKQYAAIMSQEKNQKFSDEDIKELVFVMQTNPDFKKNTVIYKIRLAAKQKEWAGMDAAKDAKSKQIADQFLKTYHDIDGLRQYIEKNPNRAESVVANTAYKFINRPGEWGGDVSNNDKIVDYILAGLKNQGVAEGSLRQHPKRLKSALGGLERAMNDLIQTDPEERQQYQQMVKQKLKTQPTAGPKGQLPEQGVAEAGPFSYGAKKPRRGSVAHNAEVRRKEQEKSRPPIEPQDQMVGTAKVTKGVAEARPWNPMDDERREQQAMDAERRAFKYAELQHELGHEDDPEWQRKMRDRDRGPWYININGKVYQQQGQPKVFDWKRGATNYALAILKNRPELDGKIYITRRSTDGDPKQLREFAPGSGSSSGRWYTDDQMVDLVGDDWANELDTGTHLRPAEQIADAQAWLEDQGYTVQVLDVKEEDSGNSWYIVGEFYNPGFARRDVDEDALMGVADPVVVITDKDTGKYLDRLALSAATTKYRLGTADAVKKQLQNQDYTTIGNYTVAAPMGGQPMKPAMAAMAEDSIARIKHLSGQGQ